MQTTKPEAADPLLETATVSAMTTLTPNHLRQLAHRGQFPKAIKFGYRTLRWRKSAVLAWMAEKEAAAEVK